MHMLDYSQILVNVTLIKVAIAVHSSPHNSKMYTIVTLELFFVRILSPRYSVCSQVRRRPRIASPLLFWLMPPEL